MDILINNAGIIRRNDALVFTEQDWDAALNVNLKTPLMNWMSVLSTLLVQPKLSKGDVVSALEL